MSTLSLGSFGSVSSRQSLGSLGSFDAIRSKDRLKKDEQRRYIREVRRRAKEAALDVKGLQTEVAELNKKLNDLEQTETKQKSDLEGLESVEEEEPGPAEVAALRQELDKTRKQAQLEKSKLESTNNLLGKKLEEQRSLYEEVVKRQGWSEDAESEDSTQQDAALQRELKKLSEDMARLQAVCHGMHLDVLGRTKTHANGDSQNTEEHSSRMEASKGLDLPRQRELLERELSSTKKFVDTLKKEEAEKQASRRRQKEALLAEVDRLRRANAMLNIEVGHKHQLQQEVTLERERKEQAQQRIQEMQATLAHMKEYQEVLQDKIKAYSEVSDTPNKADQASWNKDLDNSVSKRLFPAGAESESQDSWEMGNSSKALEKEKGLERALEEKEQELAAAQCAVEEGLAQQEAAALEVRALKEKLVSQLNEERELRIAAEKTVAELESETEELHTKLEQEQEQRSALNKSLSQAQDALSDLRHKLHKREQELRDLKSDNQNLLKVKQEHEDLEQKLQDKAEDSSADLAKKLEASERRADSLSQELDQAHLQVSELARQVEQAHNEAVSLKKQLEISQEEVTSLSSRVKELTVHIADLEEGSLEFRQELTKAQRQLKERKLGNQGAEPSEEMGSTLAELQERLRVEQEAREEAEERAEEAEEMNRELVKEKSQLWAKLAQMKKEEGSLRNFVLEGQQGWQRVWGQAGLVTLQLVLLVACLWSLMLRLLSGQCTTSFLPT